MSSTITGRRWNSAYCNYMTSYNPYLPMPKLILTANSDWYIYNFRFALIHELRDQGFEVTLVSPSGEFAVLLQQAGFSWIPWKLNQHSISPWGELRSFFDLVRIYRQERPDIVHHHTIKAVFYGSWAA